MTGHDFAGLADHVRRVFPFLEVHLSGARGIRVFDASGFLALRAHSVEGRDVVGAVLGYLGGRSAGLRVAVHEVVRRGGLGPQVGLEIAQHLRPEPLLEWKAKLNPGGRT